MNVAESGHNVQQNNREKNDSQWKLLSYLLAANTEAVALLLGAWWLGNSLNEWSPMDFSWSLVTFVGAGVVIAHSWYLIFRTVFRSQSRAEEVNKKT